MCNADGVSQFDFAAFGQTGGNDVFRNVARSICSASVYLCRIFAAECPAAVTRIAAIGINDDFASCQARIAHWAANGESPGWIDKETGIFIHQFCGDSFADDFVNDRGREFLMAGFRCMLSGNDDRINAHRRVSVVFNGNLAFSIRAEPGQFAIPACFGQTTRNAVSQRDRHGHHFRRFVTGKTKHHALISCANIHITHAAALQRVVYAHGNIRTLTMKRSQYGTSMPVKTIFSAVIADVADNFADNVIHTIISSGRHFAHYHHDAGCGAGFAGHAGIRILR